MLSAALGGLTALRCLPAAWEWLLPVCPVHAAFHVLCPGCGGTRALLALLHGDVAGAWRSNALVVALAPAAMLYAGTVAVRTIRGEAAVLPHTSRAVSCALLAMAGGWTLLRNLPR